MELKYVIYVDDDPDDRQLMEETFSKLEDYHLRLFQNGKELLGYLNEQQYIKPCLIILDINMPYLTGIDVLNILKRDPVFQEIPVALFSTSKNPMDALLCHKLGANLYVKPSNYREHHDVILKLVMHCLN